MSSSVGWFHRQSGAVNKAMLTMMQSKVNAVIGIPGQCFDVAIRLAFSYERHDRSVENRVATCVRRCPSPFDRSSRFMVRIR